jgi:hypothetical protein
MGFLPVILMGAYRCIFFVPPPPPTKIGYEDNRHEANCSTIESQKSSRVKIDDDDGSYF